MDNSELCYRVSCVCVCVCVISLHVSGVEATRLSHAPRRPADQSALRLVRLRPDARRRRRLHRRPEDHLPPRLRLAGR